MLYCIMFSGESILATIFSKKMHCFSNPELCNCKTNMLLCQIVKRIKTKLRNDIEEGYKPNLLERIHLKLGEDNAKN